MLHGTGKKDFTSWSCNNLAQRAFRFAVAGQKWVRVKRTMSSGMTEGKKELSQKQQQSHPEALTVQRLIAAWPDNLHQTPSPSPSNANTVFVTGDGKNPACPTRYYTKITERVLVCKVMQDLYHQR